MGNKVISVYSGDLDIVAWRGAENFKGGAENFKEAPDLLI